MREDLRVPPLFCQSSHPRAAACAAAFSNISCKHDSRSRQRSRGVDPNGKSFVNLTLCQVMVPPW